MLEKLEVSRCSKIQPLIDSAIPLFRQYFIPDRAIAVDEAMIAYREEWYFNSI